TRQSTTCEGPITHSEGATGAKASNCWMTSQTDMLRYSRVRVHDSRAWRHLGRRLYTGSGESEALGLVTPTCIASFPEFLRQSSEQYWDWSSRSHRDRAKPVHCPRSISSRGVFPVGGSSLER